MKASRYVVMGVAAVAAVLLAFLVRGLIAGNGAQEAKATAEAPAAPSARVLIAARELKAGTRITEADLTWQDWPIASLNAAYIVDGGNPAAAAAAGTPTPASSEAEKPAGSVAAKAGDAAQAITDKIAPSPSKEAYVGGIAREDILANEPIIDAKIVRADEGGFMAVMLQPGMRALAVPVSVDNTAGGFILPGDRVDILVTHQSQRDGGGTLDSVQPVLRNIRVLAIDQQVQTEKDKQSVIGATATLEVAPGDGQILTLAKASGTLSLMLRSYADAAGPSGAVTSAPTGSTADQPVLIYRNGQATEVTVSR